MSLFGKKKDKEKEEAAETSEAEETAEEKPQQDSSGQPSLGAIEADLMRIKAQLDSMGELRKASSERFERISEQIGELRGMITDTNKTLGTIEVGSTKAVDLVSAVQPDKLMVEVKRSDGKVEALRANIESNESIMKDIMKELKTMRQNMSFYKGVEQVIKMNEDMKKEIFDMKKMQANIERHADKVESIFLEIEKRVAGFDKFNDTVKDLDRTTKKLLQDFDKAKVTLDTKAAKKEFQELLSKFENFEKHTANVLKLMDERSKSTKRGIEERFTNLKDQLEKKFSVTLKDKKVETKDEVSLTDRAAVAAKATQQPIWKRMFSKGKKTDAKKGEASAEGGDGESAEEGDKKIIPEEAKSAEEAPKKETSQEEKPAEEQST